MSKKTQSSTGFNIQRLLVAVDGSDNARRATNAAVDLAVKYEAKLIVLHVMPRLTYEFIPVSVSAPAIPPTGFGRLYEEAQERGDEVRRGSGYIGPRTEELMPRERSWRMHPQSSKP